MLKIFFLKMEDPFKQYNGSIEHESSLEKPGFMHYVLTWTEMPMYCLIFGSHNQNSK